MTCASPLLEHAANRERRCSELRANECDIFACRSLSKSTPCLFISMRFSRTVSVTAQNIKLNLLLLPPPTTLTLLFHANTFYKNPNSCCWRAHVSECVCCVSRVVTLPTDTLSLLLLPPLPTVTGKTHTAACTPLTTPPYQALRRGP